MDGRGNRQLNIGGALVNKAHYIEQECLCKGRPMIYEYENEEGARITQARLAGRHLLFPKTEPSVRHKHLKCRLSVLHLVLNDLPYPIG